jgi:signal transduction histidine kinase/phage shock protein PspC (stress-responsive transcriptional regulator)
VAGVAAGVAAHLGLPVRLVRLAFAGGVLAMGAGPLLYAFLWATLPRADAGGRPAGRPFRPVRALLASPARRYIAWGVAGLALVGAAATIWAWRAGKDINAEWWLPVVALVGGLTAAWSQLGLGEEGGGLAGRRFSVLRLAGGLAAVTAGVVMLISRGQSLDTLLYGLAGGLAVLAGVAIVLIPWWLRLWRDLADERAARARESERADIAAHLHDSVLQTLAVMRSQAEDPEAVRRLARSQERELRSWLYEDATPPGTSLAAAMRELVAQVEDQFGVEIETVAVGDAVPGPAMEALLRATREALFNAVRHGAPPFSVYLEVSERGVDLFVRDHGAGFDIKDVPPDRLGVRESIIGRVVRQGGSARIRRPPSGGTEVELTVPDPGSTPQTAP